MKYVNKESWGWNIQIPLYIHARTHTKKVNELI